MWAGGDEDGKPYVEMHVSNDKFSKHFNPTLVTGDPEWSDYTVEVKVKPLVRTEIAGLNRQWRMTGAGRDDLPGFQHVLQIHAGRAAQRQRALVVERERHVWTLHQNIVAKYGVVPQMLQDGHVDLGVLLNPGVAGENEKSAG